MKVLLLGEFSGFYLNLKKGLMEHGAEVRLASNGDSFKKIPGADMPLYESGGDNIVFKAWKEHLMPYLHADVFYGYDVVQLINEKIFKFTVNTAILKKIRKNCGKMFVSVCGDCYSLYKTWKSGGLDYYTYDDNPEACFKYETSNPKYKYIRESEEVVDDMMDGIIPNHYEYRLGVKHKKNCRNSILYPLDCSATEYKENKPGSKIVLFHGVQKEKFKGSFQIKEAMNIIKERYPNDVEVIAAGGMPLTEYLEVMSRTNVLIDACKEHGWGYNALYAMAQGKVVLSGTSVDSMKEHGIEKTPILHITPSVEQMVAQLERVLERRSKIPEWGYESREFVEKYHDHRKVAAAYIKEWST